jgi:hypothetical protein
LLQRPSVETGAVQTSPAWARELERTRHADVVPGGGFDGQNGVIDNRPPGVGVADAGFRWVASWSTVVSIAFGSSVLGTLAGKLLDRGGARSETIREGYADAVKALNAWGQFPLRVYRRVDDPPETLVRLEALGADVKESLAYATGWVSGESAELGRIYNALVELLRAEVTVAARLAWPSLSVSASQLRPTLWPTATA